MDDDDLPPETQLTSRSLKRPRSQKKDEETDIMKRVRAAATAEVAAATTATEMTTTTTTAGNTAQKITHGKEHIVSLPTPSPPHLSQMPSSFEPVYTQHYPNSQPVLGSRPSQYNSSQAMLDYTPPHRRHGYDEPDQVITPFTPEACSHPLKL